MRGAYCDRPCRDVVGWLVTFFSCGQTVRRRLNTNRKLYRKIQWYLFQPPRLTTNLRSGPNFWNSDAFRRNTTASCYLTFRILATLFPSIINTRYAHLKLRFPIVLRLFLPGQLSYLLVCHLIFRDIRKIFRIRSATSCF